MKEEATVTTGSAQPFEWSHLGTQEMFLQVCSQIPALPGGESQRKESITALKSHATFTSAFAMIMLQLGHILQLIAGSKEGQRTHQEILNLRINFT